MKSFYILIFSSLICIKSFPQELKIVSKRNKFDLIETYSVLKDNRQVKHGTFEMKYYKKVLQKGTYDHGKKVGLWKYYSSKGAEEFIFNFDTQIVESDKPGIAREALCSEGKGYFDIITMRSIQLPGDALGNGNYFKVVVTFEVNTDGKTQNFKLKERSQNETLNQSVLDILKQEAMKLNWYPAIDDKGNRINCTLTQKFEFTVH